MAIVRDEVSAVAAEVRAASGAHDIVITSGGVGPTLDDVTMAGVADAFGHHLARCVCLALGRYFMTNSEQQQRMRCS